MNLYWIEYLDAEGSNPCGMDWTWTAKQRTIRGLSRRAVSRAPSKAVAFRIRRTPTDRPYSAGLQIIYQPLAPKAKS